jgi:hypothetical protein
MVFENTTLRRISGPTKGEPTGGWRKLDNVLYNLYSSPSILKVIKSRMMICTWHEYENACRILV